MSTAFPFFGLWSGFWPLRDATVLEAIGLAIVTSVLFPFTFNAAVVTAPISQLFFRNVSRDRRTRLRQVLCANSIGSLSSFVAVILTSVLLTAMVDAGGDAEIPAYFLLFFVCPFLVPGVCEGWLWTRWSARPMMVRAMLAHGTGRIVFGMFFVAARCVRELLLGRWVERYRSEAITFLHGVGFFCLTVLILAWFCRPKLIESPDAKIEGTVA